MQPLSHHRRSVVLAGAAAIAAAGVSGPAAAASPYFFASRQLPLGIQLFTLGPDAEKDLDGTLRVVAAIGYRKVELAGLLGRTPLEFRAALDRSGLRCTSAHVQVEELGPSGSDLGKFAADLKLLGVETVILPMAGIPRRFGAPRPREAMLDYLVRVAQGLNADDWKAAAEFLNAKGESLKAAGLQLGYHNHNVEFAPLGSTNGMEILLANTDAALVTFQMDAGWVAAAGLDPSAFLKRHSGRFTLMHVKDIKAGAKPNFALQMDPVEVGSGELDWKRLLPDAYAAGILDFYVEEEAPFTRPRLEAARISYDYLISVRA